MADEGGVTGGVGWWVGLVGCALVGLGIAGCGTAAVPVVPTAEAYTALYEVTNGPHPLYPTYDELLVARAAGATAAQAEATAIAAGRVARVQNRFDPGDGAWMLAGCIFDVQATRPDEQDASYQWAYGRVVRCDEPVADGIVEPQMGVRPYKVWVYDGGIGYFPMSLLQRYYGDVQVAGD